MAVGDVYQVVDTMDFAGQKALNVYYFNMSSGSVTDGHDAEQVAQAYVDTYVPAITAVQCSQAVHVSVKATNLFDDTDAHEILISAPGGGGPDYSNTFDAYGFRMVGDNATVRSGAKRIPGCEDVAATDGVVTDTTTLDNLNALATVMSAITSFGTDLLGHLEPVIVKRLLVGGEYKLPTSLGEAVLSFVTDVLLDALVTSQVSRKVGRGE